ncbi:hypothetical protein BJ138DRAFT_1003056 [Hygrophoropsis aurantiaca]|uniref:Uncharacterized protein n=1 Tax=Hygrophoropsis aurantiaca TaxID=72124 RepID=A0ACB8AIQ3_9AGAM|nr:hypothetical protein BJ138DRAFT_1003056 [Hygrophoropsis aurantiaca]
MDNSEPIGRFKSREMSKCYRCYRTGLEVKLSACSRCQAAKYCSKECQKADWGSHKEQCTKTVEHAESLKSIFNPKNLLPRDLKRTSTHVVRTRLDIRTDHGGSPAKYFRVRQCEAIPIAEAKKLVDPWRESLEDLEKLRKESESMGRGTVAAMAIECPPLGVQMVPFGSMKSLSSLPKIPHWKDVLFKDVENGKKFGRFGG